MRSSKGYRMLLVFVFLTGSLVPMVVRSQVGPTPVAPGRIGGAVEAAPPCPNFHWGGDGVLGVELVVFREQDLEAEADRVEPVVTKKLPAGARGWTPSGSECLERGQFYVWSLRAQRDDGWSDWSESSRFRVGLPPSGAALEAARETLRAYSSSVSARGALELGVSGVEGELSRSEKEAPEPGKESSAAGLGRATKSRSTLSGRPAVRGRGIDSSTETYGIHGVSTSEAAGSAGAVGESTATSGAVFGVQGRASGTTGIAGEFRGASGSDLLVGVGAAGEVFRVESDGDVVSQGTVVAGRFVGDGSALSGIDVDRLGGMDTLGDITSVTAGSGLVGGGVSGDVSLAIGEGAVTSAHLAPGSVTASKLAVNAIGSSEVLDGSLQGADFATASVGFADLAVAAVAGGPGGAVVDGSITHHDVNPDSVQRRVSGSCGPGSSIQSIGKDGTVSCQVDDLQIFGISPEYSISTSNPPCGRRCVFIPGLNQECFLTTVRMRQVDTPSHPGTCSIRRWEDRGGYELCAGPGACGAFTKAYSYCRSRCLTWSDRVD